MFWDGPLRDLLFPFFASASLSHGVYAVVRITEKIATPFTAF
jgi:hypothetical protein